MRRRRGRARGRGRCGLAARVVLHHAVGRPAPEVVRVPVTVDGVGGSFMVSWPWNRYVTVRPAAPGGEQLVSASIEPSGFTANTRPSKPSSAADGRVIRRPAPLPVTCTVVGPDVDPEALGAGGRRAVEGVAACGGAGRLGRRGGRGTRVDRVRVAVGRGVVAGLRRRPRGRPGGATRRGRGGAWSVLRVDPGRSPPAGVVATGSPPGVRVAGSNGVSSAPVVPIGRTTPAPVGSATTSVVTGDDDGSTEVTVSAVKSVPRRAGERGVLRRRRGSERVAAAALHDRRAVVVDEHGGAGLEHGRDARGLAVLEAVVRDRGVGAEDHRREPADVRWRCRTGRCRAPSPTPSPWRGSPRGSGRARPGRRPRCRPSRRTGRGSSRSTRSPRRARAG